MYEYFDYKPKKKFLFSRGKKKAAEAAFSVV